MFRLILKMLFDVFGRRPMRGESSHGDQQTPANTEDNSSEAQWGSTSITSPYESLTSDQLVELYCSGLTWPTISEVVAVLERRGISYKEPTLLANQPPSDAAVALQYRPYALADLQDWPRAEAVCVGFDQAAADRLVALPEAPLPELSLDEYAKACAVFYNRRGTVTIAGRPADLTLGQIEELIVRAWKFDAADWHGPDRARWHLDRNVVSPSPDGRFACVLYSCGEISLNWVVGLLALLKGPPENPTVMLSPARFTCYCGSNSIQWLGGGRYCVVIPYLLDQSANRIERLAFTFFDLANQSFAEDEITNLAFVGEVVAEVDGQWVIRSRTDEYGKCQERVLDHQQLTWRPWGMLTGTSETPETRTLREKRPFIETPWGDVYQEE